MLDNKLLSEIVAYRTYAKFNQSIGRRETLEETISRNMNMHLDRFPKLSTDIVKAYQRIYQLKVMPSMRLMQFSGEATLKNNARAYNCSFAPIQDTKVFSEALFLLLSGVGFGYSVQRRHVNQLPKLMIPRETGVYVIHDSIQGWADSLNVLLEAYFYGKMRPEFDFSNIRAKGSYLVTSGAKAPGPEPLRAMLKLVEERLKVAIGRKLRPIEVHDIICIVSDCVLAGGIRRAALISIFDFDDEEMLKSKQGTWWEKHPYRARANNSAIFLRDSTTKEQFDYVFDMCKQSGSGEPGFIWSNNLDMGVNPCCFSGDTTILTSEGKVKFRDLKFKSCKAINYKGEIVDCVVWSNGIKDTIKLTPASGESIVCTEDHEFLEYETGNKIKAKDSLGKIIAVGLQHHTGVMITSISLNGKEEVFDFALNDEDHWGLVGDGIVAHNCEIALNPMQFCNLTTINQTGIKDKRDFFNRIYAATLVGTLQATYTDFHYLRPIWKETTERDALLGVSFTGIADSAGVITNDLLVEGAKHVLEINEKYAKKLGINLAARSTCVKPEGSASTVLGSSSGIHARHAEYYIRRIRMNKGDALTNYLLHVIPDLVESDVFSSNGVVVSIPQASPKGSIIRHDETALTLLNRTLDYNKYWIANGHREGDNKHNVSVTISVKEDEWESLRASMWDNRYDYTGISLLPFDGGSYIQAPFEDCSKETYLSMYQKIKDIDLSQVTEESDNTNRTESIACGGGACEII